MILGFEITSKSKPNSVVSSDLVSIHILRLIFVSLILESLRSRLGLELIMTSNHLHCFCCSDLDSTVF